MELVLGWRKWIVGKVHVLVGLFMPLVVVVVHSGPRKRGLVYLIPIISVRWQSGKKTGTNRWMSMVTLIKSMSMFRSSRCKDDTKKTQK